MWKKFPDWLAIWVQKALLGNIYPKLRAVALGYREDRTVVIRFYLESEADDLDREIIDVVCTEILSNTSSNEEVPRLDEELVYTREDLKDISPLSGFVFMRMEGKVGAAAV